jgi:hypothetical protein
MEFSFSFEQPLGRAGIKRVILPKENEKDLSVASSPMQGWVPRAKHRGSRRKAMQFLATS